MKVKNLIKYWRINTDKDKTSDEYGMLNKKFISI